MCTGSSYSCITGMKAWGRLEIGSWLWLGCLSSIHPYPRAGIEGAPAPGSDQAVVSEQ